LEAALTPLGSLFSGENNKRKVRQARGPRRAGLGQASTRPEASIRRQRAFGRILALLFHRQDNVLPAVEITLTRRPKVSFPG